MDLQKAIEALKVTVTRENGFSPKIIQELDTVIQASKKQTPKKPIIWNVSEKGKMTNTYYFCYICDNLLSRSCHEYCPGCGQAIDWD